MSLRNSAGCVLATWALVSPTALHAKPVDASLPAALGEDSASTSATRPLLPKHLTYEPDNYFVVGVGIERFGENFSGRSQDDNLLFGLAAMYRIGSFGPHVLLMAKPSVDSYQDSRFLAGAGLRGYFEVPGLTEFSYGVGTHVEARFEDHYWLAYATPAELGATVYRRGSWHIDVFLGARRAMAGHLINYFLIDPNGIDNQDAKDELYRARHEDAWKGFLRIVFSRRVD